MSVVAFVILTSAAALIILLMVIGGMRASRLDSDRIEATYRGTEFRIVKTGSLLWPFAVEAKGKYDWYQLKTFGHVDSARGYINRVLYERAEGLESGKVIQEFRIISRVESADYDPIKEKEQPPFSIKSSEEL